MDHQKLGSALWKFRRTETRPPIEMLPKEVLGHVMLFLGSSRDVYSLSMCGSKHIRAAITTEIVVFSACQTDNTRILDMICLDLRCIAIHIPSTFRLLRLLNARRCERGENCCGYDPIKKISGGMDTIPSDTSYGFDPEYSYVEGLRFCKACVARTLIDAPHVWLSIQNSEGRYHSTLKLSEQRRHHSDLIGGGKSTHLFEDISITDTPSPMKEAVTGEVIGPIIPLRRSSSDYRKQRDEILNVARKARRRYFYRRENDKMLSIRETEAWEALQTLEIKRTLASLPSILLLFIVGYACDFCYTTLSNSDCIGDRLDPIVCDRLKESILNFTKVIWMMRIWYCIREVKLPKIPKRWW